jgi:hypothetical protein
MSDLASEPPPATRRPSEAPLRRPERPALLLPEYAHLTGVAVDPNP